MPLLGRVNSTEPTKTFGFRSNKERSSWIIRTKKLSERKPMCAIKWLNLHICGGIVYHMFTGDYHHKMRGTLLCDMLLALLFTHGVFASKFQEYILAPKDRSVTPLSLHAVYGDVKNADALCTNVHEPEGLTFGPNSSIILDFGKNIAGTVDFNVRSVSGTDEYIGFSFTESSMWISPYHCDSGTSATYDSPLWFNIPKKGRYAADKSHQRGGFRYLSVWHNSTGTVSLKDLSVSFTASPEMKNPADYLGYFNTDSEKLNRVWYAGAYTNQLCTADPTTGNALGIPGSNWYYNGTIASEYFLISNFLRHCLIMTF